MDATGTTLKSVAVEAKMCVFLAANYGFRGRDLSEIESVIVTHRDQLIEAWNEYFS